MFCDQAKEYLSQKGIKFQERDIAQDPSALAELKKLGYMTTPVIVVDYPSSLFKTQRQRCVLKRGNAQRNVGG